MSDAVAEIVVGETRVDFIAPIVDENGVAVNITGSTFALQGTSDDLPAKTINVAGAILDGALGLAKWAGIGDSATYVSVADLGSKARARFKLRVKWTDSAGKVDFGDEMLWDWVEPPI